MERVEACLNCQRFVECNDFGRFEDCKNFSEVEQDKALVIIRLDDYARYRE